MNKSSNTWYTNRGYLHFDLPISIKRAESIVTIPGNIERHSFYPFISHEITSKKIKKDSETKVLGKSRKIRRVSYASHVDSHIYSYYANLLSEKYEKAILKNGINDNVIAFRKLGKSNIDFANHAFDEIRSRNFCGVIALDVSGFFDNLNHSILKDTWCKILNVKTLPLDHYKVFRSLTKHSMVDRGALYQSLSISKNNPKNGRRKICEPSEFRNIVRSADLIKTNPDSFGIPQGSPISALLSNIYMLDFDIKISSLMKKNNVRYYRYCDDILCITPLASMGHIENILIEEIAKLELEINKSKTKRHEFRIVHGRQVCDPPLQYLGFTFDGQRKLIRSSALARYSERMKSGVRLAKLTKIKYNSQRIERGHQAHPLYKKKLYDRYSHLGQRNFIRYALRSAVKMNSQSIRKQLKPLWKRLQDEIKKT